MRGHRRGRDSMLARARFRDDARFAHLDGKKTLTNSVIDFVRSGVEEVFALKVDARAAQLCSEARCELQRSGAASEVRQEILKLRLK